MSSEAERILELEFQLAHLQRHVEQLDDVVRKLNDAFDRQRLKIESLELQLRDLKSKPREAGDLLDEKPPHY